MKTNLLCIAAAAIAFAASAAFAGPGIVGNGGDVVRCAKAPGSPFEGLYSLDYLLTYQTREQNRGIVPVTSWESSYQRLSRLLAAGNSDLASAFDGFVRGMDNFDDWTAARIWREAGFGLVPIDDQNIIHKLPLNCQTPAANQSIDVIQAVVQVQRPNQVEYDYDPAVYQELKTSAPLQFSFLMVHEWLWHLTSDVRVIRNIDDFLHSAGASALAPAAFNAALSNIGLDLVPHGFKNVCDRATAVRDRLVESTGKLCAEIAEPDLRIGTFSLRGIPVREVAYDDFTGMKQLSELDLSYTGLEMIFEHSLDEMTVLRKLNLSGNYLQVIGPALFANKALVEVNLSNNSLKSIPKGVYAGGKDLLDLSKNQLTELPVEICKVIADGGTLDIRGNPLNEQTKKLFAEDQVCQHIGLLMDRN